MQTISPTTPVLDPKCILLIGPPGGGKSTLMLTFPKIDVINLDLNLAGPTRYLKEQGTLQPYKEDHSVVDCEPEERMGRVIELIDECKQDQDCQWIGMDSLTHLNEFLIRKVLYDQKKTGNNAVMEPHFWGPFKTHMLNIMFSKLRASGKHCIATVHETFDEEAAKAIGFTMKKNIIKRKPTIQGGVSKFFGGFFTDIWRVSKERIPESVPGITSQVLLETEETSLDNLKNSLGLPAEIVNPTYETIKPYLKKAGYEV